ncbi:MAG: radical SAM protein [Clostridiales bacterium]|nr:radical SAM protein [Clostridiales bacterium]
MHFVKAKGILSATNGMNLYRGCTHGCIYCDSRSVCYQMQHDFEDVEVKENAPELLMEALRRKRQKCIIGTGSMSDPYIPQEEELQLTRRALTIIRDMGFGLAIQTKSDRILRDMDLLRDINNRVKCVVQMTLTTWDDKLCAILEPNVANTQARLRVLKAMQREGIPTVVWMTPILPFINDGEDNIRSIVEACADAGVYGIIHFGMGMTLREGDREYYYTKLDEHFPGLRQRYVRTYGNRYELSCPGWKRLEEVFSSLCDKAGIIHNEEQLFQWMRQMPQTARAEQISLFDML